MTHFTLISFTTGTRNIKIDSASCKRNIFHSDDEMETAKHWAEIRSSWGVNGNYLETILLVNGIDAFANDSYPAEAALFEQVFQLVKTLEASSK